MTTDQLLIVYLGGCEMGDTTGGPAWRACLADSSSSCSWLWLSLAPLVVRTIRIYTHESTRLKIDRTQAGDERTNEQASRSTEPLVETNKV